MDKIIEKRYKQIMRENIHPRMKNARILRLDVTMFDYFLYEYIRNLKSKKECEDFLKKLMKFSTREEEFFVRTITQIKSINDIKNIK